MIRQKIIGTFDRVETVEIDPNGIRVEEPDGGGSRGESDGDGDDFDSRQLQQRELPSFREVEMQLGF